MIARALWMVLGVAAGGGLGWWAFRGMDMAGVLQGVAALDWRLLVLATGAVFLAGLLEALRWKLLLPAERVSARRLFLVRSVGEGLNNLSPVRIVADVVQTTLLRFGDGIGLDKVLSSLLLGKLLDMLVTCGLLGLGLLLLPQLSGLRPLVLPLWALGLVSVIALVFLADRLHKIPFVTRLAIARSVLRSIGDVGRRRLALLGSLALTAMASLSIGSAAWLVAQAAGVDLPFWLICVVIMAVSVMASSVPAPPGGLGVYEFAAVSTLGLFAVDATVAMTFALVIHALILLPPVLIAAVVLATDRKTIGHTVASIRSTMRWGIRRPATVK